MDFRRFPIAAAPVLLALAGCHHDRGPTVRHAWVRLPAVSGRPAAAYLTLDGGPEPLRLIAIDSPQAGSSELHESMKMGAGGGMAGQMTGMRRLDGLDLPAHGTLAFAPGGDHVMLFGIAPQLKPGAKITLAVRFEKGQPLQTEAKVVGAGDPAPY